MPYRREEIDYLRRKARQFRELASEDTDQLSAKMLELAKGLDAYAATLEKKRRSEGTMQPYRVYFRQGKQGIVGRDDFEAEDDRTALAIAETLRNASSDVCDSFELWKGVRLVGTRDAFPKLDARLLNAKTQAAVVEREERLLESKWAIAKSRRLLERLRDQRA